MDRLASAYLGCVFYKHFETVCACISLIGSSKYITAEVGRLRFKFVLALADLNTLVILLVISRTNRTCGWNFPPITSFSFIQDPCFLFWCFWRTASHSSPAQEKEKAAGIRGKIFRERPPASQPTSKRLPFDSLFVLLTDRITLSYTIHERC